MNRNVGTYLPKFGITFRTIIIFSGFKFECLPLAYFVDVTLNNKLYFTSSVYICVVDTVGTIKD
jgi:hypothetical protein